METGLTDARQSRHHHRLTLALRRLVTDSMTSPRPAGAVLNIRSLEGGETAAPIDHDFFFGGEGDAVGGLGDLHFGQEADGFVQRLHVHVGHGAHDLNASFVGEQAQGFFCADEQALARAHAGVPAAGDGVMLAAVLVRALRRGALNARRAGQDQVGFAQFGEFRLAFTCVGACACAFSVPSNGLVLVCNGFGYIALVAGFLRLVLQRQVAQTVVLAVGVL